MKNKFLGLLFLFLAVAICLNQLNIIKHIPILSIAATVFCGSWMIKHLYRFNIAGIVLPSMILFLVYNKEYQFTNIDLVSVLLIACLTYFGLKLLFPSSKKFKKILSLKSHSTTQYKAIFSERINYISHKNLDEASIHCVCGDMKLYFNEAQMRDDTFTLNVDIKCGDVKLFIPSDWKVVSQATILFGDINKSDNAPRVKTLIIEGQILFGNIDIHYV